MPGGAALVVLEYISLVVDLDNGKLSVRMKMTTLDYINLDDGKLCVSLGWYQDMKTLEHTSVSE